MLRQRQVVGHRPLEAQGRVPRRLAGAHRPPEHVHGQQRQELQEPPRHHPQLGKEGRGARNDTQGPGAGPINGTCPTGDEHRRHHGEARGRLHDRHGDALRRHVLMWLQGYEIGFARICRPCASKYARHPLKARETVLIGCGKKGRGRTWRN